jgi:hypothetical protein
VVFDEIEDSASFVYGIAKRARKYYLALTTATQDVGDFLSTDYGKAVLSNSSIQILLKQSPTEIDTVSQIFYLSKGERELLLSVGVGEGLFFAGQSHVVLKVVASPFEKELATSNPAEIKAREDKNAYQDTPPLQSLPTAPINPFPTAPQTPPTEANQGNFSIPVAESEIF